MLIILVESAYEYYAEEGEGVSFVIENEEELKSIMSIAERNQLDCIVKFNNK